PFRREARVQVVEFPIKPSGQLAVFQRNDRWDDPRLIREHDLDSCLVVSKQNHDLWRTGPCNLEPVAVVGHEEIEQLERRPDEFALDLRERDRLAVPESSSKRM